MARSRSSAFCVCAADAAHDITTAPSKRTFIVFACPRDSCDGKHFISARELSASLRFFFAEFLETRIVAQRIPGRTDTEVAGRFAIRHFEKMRQSGDGGIDIAKLCLNSSQITFSERFD